MSAIAGFLLFIVGITGAIWPEATIRFWFFGAVDEDSMSDSGKMFFQGLEALCAVIGILVSFMG